MAIATTITRPIQKNIPKASGIIQAGVVGIGSYSVARFLDGLIGGRLSAIGIGLPIVGSLSVLDLIMILSFKAVMRKNSLVAAAFAGDRVFNLRTGVPGLAQLNINAQSISSTTGPQGGGF